MVNLPTWNRSHCQLLFAHLRKQSREYLPYRTRRRDPAFRRRMHLGCPPRQDPAGMDRNRQQKRLLVSDIYRPEYLRSQNGHICGHMRACAGIYTRLASIPSVPMLPESAPTRIRPRFGRIQAEYAVIYVLMYASGESVTLQDTRMGQGLPGGLECPCLAVRIVSFPGAGRDHRSLRAAMLQNGRALRQDGGARSLVFSGRYQTRPAHGFALPRIA